MLATSNVLRFGCSSPSCTVVLRAAGAGWPNGYGVGLVATQNVAGSITSPFSGNNFGHVVRTHVPLSSSSII